MNPLQGLPETQTSPTTSPTEQSSQTISSAISPSIVNLSDTMSKQLPSKYLHLLLLGLTLVSAVEIFLIHDFYTCVYLVPITWFIPLLFYALKDTALLNSKNTAIINDLVTNYGFSLAGNRPVDVDDGSLNLYPGTKIIRTLIRGVYKQQEIEEFNFSWYYGKNSAGGFPVMRTTLTGDFPPLLITHVSNAQENNPGLFEEIRLEGDFSLFFSVFTKPDCNIACLEIMTPDVMEYIEDNAKAYTFEFVQNHLYMYDYSFETVSQALAGFDLLLGLASKIKPINN
jgi:hypothetical protein